MFMLEGKASDRFRPYEYALKRTGLTHSEFAQKHRGTTVCKYLIKNGLVDDCIEWMKQNYPNEKFSLLMNSAKQTDRTWRTYVHYLEHVKMKIKCGKGFWDDSPKFFHTTLPTLMRKTMFTVVHPLENRFLNAREMMHMMGLPHQFDIDHPR